MARNHPRPAPTSTTTSSKVVQGDKLPRIHKLPQIRIKTAIKRTTTYSTYPARQQPRREGIQRTLQKSGDQSYSKG